MKIKQDDLFLPEDDYHFPEELWKKISIEGEDGKTINTTEHSIKSRKKEIPNIIIEKKAVNNEKSIPTTNENNEQLIDVKTARIIYKNARNHAELLKLLLEAPSDQLLIKYFNQYRKSELNKLLKKQPIEMLNSRKAGIRVSALKNSGFFYLSDINGLSYAQLMSIPGIGDANATSIISESRFLSAQFNKQISLLPQHSDVYALNMILACYKYLNLRQCCKMNTKDFREYFSNLKTLIHTTTAITKRLSWLFYSKKKKTFLLNEAKKLLDYMTDEKLRSVTERIKVNEEIQKALPKEAWQDYLANSDKYKTILSSYLP